jgi:filamentous hemagglutinin
MHLPGAQDAVAAPAKVRDDRLAADHPDNSGKAAFLLRFGFTPAGWEALPAALTRHPLTNPIVRASQAPEGKRYRVQCSLRTPDGRTPCIVSVWATETGQAPRLVTPFPG